MTRRSIHTLRTRIGRLAAALRRIIGAPDYERYLIHMRGAHPELRPLSASEFARTSLSRRYDNPGSRCC